MSNQVLEAVNKRRSDLEKNLEDISKIAFDTKTGLEKLTQIKELRKENKMVT